MKTLKPILNLPIVRFWKLKILDDKIDIKERVGEAKDRVMN